MIKTLIDLLLQVFKQPVHIKPSAVVINIKSGPSQQCLDLIAKFEGLKLSPYLCSAGVPTIGYGATYYKDGTLVTMKDPIITVDMAKELLAIHVKSFYNQVKTITNGLNLTENQLSALTSFSYNLGIGALLKSTLLKKIKIDINDKTIYDEFLKWNKAGGKELIGLTRRREDEAKLYFS